MVIVMVGGGKISARLWCDFGVYHMAQYRMG
jgi:hypothetical protein